jgi:hypothetical protein
MQPRRVATLRRDCYKFSDITWDWSWEKKSASHQDVEMRSPFLGSFRIRR